MAKIHTQSFKVNTESVHKLMVCSKVTGLSKARIFELLLDKAYRDVKQCNPKQVEDVEKELIHYA
jgi:hypothetical protein